MSERPAIEGALPPDNDKPLPLEEKKSLIDYRAIVNLFPIPALARRIFKDGRTRPTFDLVLHPPGQTHRPTTRP